RLCLGGLDPDDPARERRAARRQVRDEPPGGGVGRRVDQPLLAWVLGQNRRNLGEERRLQPGQRRLRERAYGSVLDAPLVERKRRGARKRTEGALVEAERLSDGAPVAEEGR